MTLTVLNEDNVEQYTDYLSEDIAENIGRTFFHGVIAQEMERPMAGIVWETRNVLEEADAESNILFLRIDDEAATDALFDEYENQIRMDNVKKSLVSLPAKASKKEKQILRDRGFTIGLMEGDDICANVSELARIQAFSKIKISDAINPLKNVTQRAFNGAVSKMASQGRYGLCQDLAYLPRLYFENDVSCYAEEDGKINGMLLLHLMPSGKLKVILMTVEGKKSTILIPQMIKQAVTSALEEYGPDTEVIIDRHNYSSLALSEKLFPRGFGIPVYMGERKESGE